ncbi:MAG: hypothetical protein OXU79_21270 [Gemmatimonadota bacterium]|nr:hypothetical protein [Gemmatimonadota bacterium]
MKSTSIILVASLLFEILSPGISYASGQLSVDRTERAGLYSTAGDREKPIPSSEDTAAEIVERALRRSFEKDFIVMSQEDLDHSKLKPGWHATVVYKIDGVRTIAIGRIARKDSDSVAVNSVPEPWRRWEIRYNDIEAIVTYKHRKKIERWLETNALPTIHRLPEDVVSYVSRPDLDPKRIKKGWHAHVVYANEDGRRIATGKIEIKRPGYFVIRSGSTPWSWKIPHDKIETLVTYKDRRNIERWLKARQAIVRLDETVVETIASEDFDLGRLKTGRHATIVYRTKGVRKIVSGEIVNIEADRIDIQSSPLLTWKIAISHIDTLVFAEYRSDMERWLREKHPPVRVKARSFSRRRIIGRFFGVDRDTLVLVTGRGFERVPLSSVDNFEVSIGRFRNAGKGMRIGLVLGLAILAPVALSDLRADDYKLRGLATAITATYVFPLIFLGSTLIGAATRTERWVKVSPPRLNLSIAPARNTGLRAAVSFNF